MAKIEVLDDLLCDYEIPFDSTDEELNKLGLTRKEYDIINFEKEGVTILDISNFLRGNIVVMIITVIAAIVAFTFGLKNPNFALAFDKFKLKMPLLGDLIRKALSPGLPEPWRRYYPQVSRFWTLWI